MIPFSFYLRQSLRPLARARPPGPHFYKIHVVCMFFCFAFSNASSRGAKRRKIRSLPHPPVRQNPHLILPGESCIITLFSHWPVCRNGRRGGLKIPWWQHRVGSTPTTGIKSPQVDACGLFSLAAGRSPFPRLSQNKQRPRDAPRWQLHPGDVFVF